MSRYDSSARQEQKMYSSVTCDINEEDGTYKNESIRPEKIEEMFTQYDQIQSARKSG